MYLNEKKSEIDRISAIENICIMYPRMKKIVETIDRCRHDSKYAGEPQSLLLIGESGAGKSTVINQYAKRNPVLLKDDGMTIPVLVSSLPSKATIKGVIHELLYSLKAPRPGTGTAIEATYRLITLLTNCKVELIILDEFQHLLQRASGQASEEIADWLKQLINKSHIPILLVGMPGSERLLEKFPQLARRFSQILELGPFSYINERAEFLGFLYALQSQLPFEKQGGVHLSDPISAMRIFVASNGSQAWTVRLIREASKLAVRSGAVCLQNEHLSAAYDEFLYKYSKRDNPWLSSATEIELAIPEKTKGTALWKNY